ncbi:Zn-dependent hydrolase, including glyoxylase [Candidatus Scalindua japonica]|uniref:Zn-dependent hydrolase, including glyoxylase n=1 Tax=Candidatus Scalindua japonica TaxID=1284222 RepID=A0A286TXX0_9BACT|nr:MBL fold metallo-hydrolase [Candidatus Scalindua japonica]GAX60745.1 Zn-dependent hydrolase, including glyoxylase [Candidatus Scalindua japonica]
MINKNIVVGPLEVNCYIIGCEDTKEAAIIDPGDNADAIIRTIEAEGLKPEFIINTHAHFDHIGGVKEIQDYFKIEFFLHKEDLFLVSNASEQAASFGLKPIPKPEVNKYINNGDTISLGNKTITVIHTPGHSPGCVCYNVDSSVFVGDTLFASSIGRTDLPGGSYETLINSIKERLFPLGDSTTVYPGHGPSTTIGNEKEHNPFLK